MRLVVSFAILLGACARGAAPAPAASSAPAAITGAPTSPPDAPRCLPIVSGCGCAYACAVTVHVLDGGVHEVAHDLQDSRLDRVTVERWCFDRDGRGAPERAASPSQTQCFEVFYDGTPCGGECIPRADTLRCQQVRARCAAAPSPPPTR